MPWRDENFFRRPSMSLPEEGKPPRRVCEMQRRESRCGGRKNKRDVPWIRLINGRFTTTTKHELKSRCQCAGSDPEILWEKVISFEQTLESSIYSNFQKMLSAMCQRRPMKTIRNESTASVVFGERCRKYKLLWVWSRTFLLTIFPQESGHKKGRGIFRIC